MDFEDNNPFSAIEGEAAADTFSDRTDDEAALAAPRAKPAGTQNVLAQLGKQPITIVDAGKSREGTKRGHITYTIKVGGISVRRRYSEFESLRRTLRRLFPTIVVPPIPEKHTMSAYAANPTHAQEDARVIDHRRRMLAVFLNRCLDIPAIRNSFLLERFLDPNSSWTEVLTSEPVLAISKSPLQAPPLDPSHPSHGHAYLPIPPSGARLRNDPDPAFKDAEASAKEYEMLIGSGLDKAARRIIRQYTAFSADSADLGGQFNAFSLESQGPLATAIEKVGQAVDTGYISTEALVDSLSVEFSEPLAESVQLAQTARQVLKYRRYRALQVEMTGEALSAKRSALADLERADSEAQRISSYLHADERINAALSGSMLGNGDRGDRNGANGTVAGSPETREDVALLMDGAMAGTMDAPESSRASVDRTDIRSDTASLDEPITYEPVKRAGFRLPGLASINHAIHGMMDVDPEASRRNNITRTQEQIANLGEALKVARQDAATTSEAVKTELDRYKQVKDQDLKKLVRAFVRCHIEWAEKNLESWLEARQAIRDN